MNAKSIKIECGSSCFSILLNQVAGCMKFLLSNYTHFRHNVQNRLRIYTRQVPDLYRFINTVVVFCILFEFHYSSLFIKKPFPASETLGKRVSSRITYPVDLIVSARSRIDVFLIIQLLLNQKNRWERRGLKTVIPVLLCLETK